MAPPEGLPPEHRHWSPTAKGTSKHIKTVNLKLNSSRILACNFHNKKRADLPQGLLSSALK
jgi:hypothetical protein